MYIHACVRACLPIGIQVVFPASSVSANGCFKAYDKLGVHGTGIRRLVVENLNHDNSDCSGRLDTFFTQLLTFPTATPVFHCSLILRPRVIEGNAVNA